MRYRAQHLHAPSHTKPPPYLLQRRQITLASRTLMVLPVDNPEGVLGTGSLGAIAHMEGTMLGGGGITFGADSTIWGHALAGSTSGDVVSRPVVHWPTTGTGCSPCVQPIRNDRGLRDLLYHIRNRSR